METFEKKQICIMKVIKFENNQWHVVIPFFDDATTLEPNSVLIMYDGKIHQSLFSGNLSDCHAFIELTLKDFL